MSNYDILIIAMVVHCVEPFDFALQVVLTSFNIEVVKCSHVVLTTFFVQSGSCILEN